MLKLENYSKLPLGFEANQGQTDSQVKFLARGRGYTMFLTAAESVLVLHQPGNEESKTKTSMLRMTLSGANQYPQVKGLDELPGKANYFIGNDPDKWCVNIPTYSKIEFRDVFPGVDMVCYGNQEQLEYDFVISPGVDPNIITLDFQGIHQLEIDEQDSLVVHSDSGHILLHKPFVYQDIDGKRNEIPVKYLLKDRHEVGFQLEYYDVTRTLVIDPKLDYSTYLGGSSNDYGFGIAVDSSGNAYVTGYTGSTNFPTANPLQSSNAGDRDAFVAKINATGSALVYSTYLGGSSDDYGHDIAVDSSGNAYVTGYTGSTNFPTANPIQPSNAGNRDAFVTKINAAGSSLVYSTYLGGSSSDYGRGIAVDSFGNTYVTGYTISTNFPTANPIQPFNAGDWDAFVTKINAAGSALVYSTYLGDSNSDYGLGIAVDSSGNAYVTGHTLSTNFPTVNPIQPSNAGGADAFVSKFNTAGSVLVYSTYLGSSSDDGGWGIAVDSSGNAYVTGYTDSTNFPTANPIQPSNAGGTDAFVSKFNTAGSVLVYSTYLGGSSDDGGWGIAVDSSGNAYVTGYTDSTDFPTANPIQPSNAGGTDAFVSKISEYEYARIACNIQVCLVINSTKEVQLLVPSYGICVPAPCDTPEIVCP